MTRARSQTIPASHSAHYKAAQHLFQHGPMSERDLRTAISFGHRSSAAADNLQRAITKGWLVTTGDGLIKCSDLALDHFESKPQQKYVGKVAAPRQIDVMSRPTYQPPKRVIRADVPAWSVRQGVTFHRG